MYYIYVSNYFRDLPALLEGCWTDTNTDVWSTETELTCILEKQRYIQSMKKRGLICHCLALGTDEADRHELSNEFGFGKIDY